MGEATELSDRGLYGDAYGSVTSLFTGLAFSALIFTIMLQQREIKLQREDLNIQMEEMRLSREEIARQGDLQQEKIELDVASLKMKTLEVEIIEIKITAERWTLGERLKNVQPMLDEVKNKMKEILDGLKERNCGCPRLLNITKK